MPRLAAGLGFLLASTIAAAADDATDCASGDPAKGIPACTRIIERAGEPQEKLGQAYGNRGTTLALQGRYQEALADLDEAVRLNPNDADSFHARGRVHGELGDWDGAIAEFDAALRADPRHVDALISRGSARQLQGRVDLALADFSEAVKVDPNNPDAYSSRGALYLATSRFPEARADLDQAIKLDPDFGTAYLNRGLTISSSASSTGRSRISIRRCASIRRMRTCGCSAVPRTSSRSSRTRRSRRRTKPFAWMRRIPKLTNCAAAS
jgi:tetratricopeptide (TPR) repeat protein